jgi:hypothetical protein
MAPAVSCCIGCLGGFMVWVSDLGRDSLDGGLFPDFSSSSLLCSRGVQLLVSVMASESVSVVLVLVRLAIPLNPL